MKITNLETRRKLDSFANYAIDARTPGDLPKMKRFLSLYFKQQIGAKLAENTDLVLHTVCLTNEWSDTWALLIKGEGHKAFREWFFPVAVEDWTQEPAILADRIARTIANNR
jgi:hypothetical protein